MKCAIGRRTCGLNTLHLACTRHNATDAVDAVDADEDEVFRTIAHVRGDDPRVSTDSPNDVEDDEDVARNDVGDLDGRPLRNVRAEDGGRRRERGGHVQVGGV